MPKENSGLGVSSAGLAPKENIGAADLSAVGLAPNENTGAAGLSTAGLSSDLAPKENTGAGLSSADLSSVGLRSSGNIRTDLVSGLSVDFVSKEDGVGLISDLSLGSSLYTFVGV